MVAWESLAEAASLLRVAQNGKRGKANEGKRTEKVKNIQNLDENIGDTRIFGFRGVTNKGGSG